MDCRTGTKNIIRQIKDLLELLDKDQYAKPLPIYNGSSIGQHFRHIFDFYQCLALDVSNGSIDYARRERDPYIEQDPQYAKAAFTKLEQTLVYFNEEAIIDVLADFSADRSVTRPMVKSSVGRELMFAHDHAVHHMAIIKIGFQIAFPALNFPINAGVAPSTIKHRAEEKASD